MSDFGDEDFYDYEDAWMYIEDEYLPADDLAEHAVHSPPPTFLLEEDEDADNTHFDYFLDLDYGSDGYDDAEFYTHNPHSQDMKAGQKRKRGADLGSRRRKKLKLGDGLAVSSIQSSKLVHPPVVWRRHRDRGTQVKLLEGDTKSYAIMKDWRERLAETPDWKPRGSSPATSLKANDSKNHNAEQVVDDLLPQAPDTEDPGDADDGMATDALMAALQRNLAAAGGPLTGMDPQQLLQFAMRMMNNQDAGDDIAGELADDLLDRLQEEGEEDEEEAPAGIMDWLSKNRQPTQAEGSEVESHRATSSRKSHPMEQSTNSPTPPVTEANMEYHIEKAAKEEKTEVADSMVVNQAKNGARNEQRKRKKDDEADSTTQAAPRKRATRSYDAPTAASQARAANKSSSGGRPSRKRS